MQVQLSRQCIMIPYMYIHAHNYENPIATEGGVHTIVVGYWYASDLCH